MFDIHLFTSYGQQFSVIRETGPIRMTPFGMLLVDEVIQLSTSSVQDLDPEVDEGYHFNKLLDVPVRILPDIRNARNYYTEENTYPDTIGYFFPHDIAEHAKIELMDYVGDWGNAYDTERSYQASGALIIALRTTSKGLWIFMSDWTTDNTFSDLILGTYTNFFHPIVFEDNFEDNFTAPVVIGGYEEAGGDDFLNGIIREDEEVMKAIMVGDDLIDAECGKYLVWDNE